MPNSNRTIKHFIKTAIENHICDVEHSDYEKLLSLFRSELLLELSSYLENYQEKKFDDSMEELLEENELKLKILMMIESKEQPQVVTKGISLNDDTKLCTVFYGTNREMNDKENLSLGYGNKRADKIYLGTCEVSVPESRKKGETKGSWWDKIIKFDSSHGDLELKSISLYDEEGFWSTISDLYTPLEEEEKQALVFIHGYNTSFNDAAIRAAQLATDLEHSGLTAFFSWPSKGSLLGYVADEASIQYSEKYITTFLTDFVEKSGANRVHIIAHSMGNRGLLEAINRINKERPEIQFGQIILAAPDIDADVFSELADAYTKQSEQTTLYVSSADKAVGASKWIHSHARAGFTPPVSVVPQMDTIEVETEVDLLQLGHGYFAEHASLLGDIDKLIAFNLHACDREELLANSTECEQTYYKLKG
jgi:esterase/lipase superfamily enzyme